MKLVQLGAAQLELLGRRRLKVAQGRLSRDKAGRGMGAVAEAVGVGDDVIHPGRTVHHRGRVNSQSLGAVYSSLQL